MKSIIVENVSKCYKIQPVALVKFGPSLRDAIYNGLKRKLYKLFHPKTVLPSETKDFWSLKDVNLEFFPGDRVGIIGRNGAGKSTLLKILSRITEPTKGKVTLRGRVASLLEVATGFHPDLTGRENIYLNGAILGMTRKEIREKFDQIVEFSDIGEFLDTPVKRYSSGMYIRLAFSIPAHLNPEILLVDEVLAVGDAQFQKKCLGKMSEITYSGDRTVLFVSHNMGAIEQFCNRAVFLKKGQVHSESRNVSEIVRQYLAQENIQNSWHNTKNEYDHPYFKPLDLSFRDSDGKEVSMPIANDQELYIQIDFEIKKLDSALVIGFSIFNEYGTCIFLTYHTDTAEQHWPKLRLGLNRLCCPFPKRLMNEGQYRLECSAALHWREWILEPGKDCPSIVFKIQGGLSDSPYWIQKRGGVVAPQLNWLSKDI